MDYFHILFTEWTDFAIVIPTFNIFQLMTTCCTIFKDHKAFAYINSYISMLPVFIATAESH